MTDNLDSIVEQTRLTLAAKDRAREKAMPRCRDTIRHSSLAIRAIHRQEFDKAEESLQAAHARSRLVPGGIVNRAPLHPGLERPSSSLIDRKPTKSGSASHA